MDGVLSSRQEVIDRGIVENVVITVDETTGSFRSSMSIPRDDINKNITIICIADSFTSIDINSNPILFQVQGLLDVPTNLMLSKVANEQHIIRRLSWEKPFSLDITDVDPDINNYKVCYSLVGSDLEMLDPQCLCVNQHEWMFLYVDVSLLFTVSAVNVVGVGNASSILHEAVDCNTNSTGLINPMKVNYH